MQKQVCLLSIITCLFFLQSCNTDDDVTLDTNPDISFTIPENYSFERDGIPSDVRVTGQTERIAMLEEIDVAFTDFEGEVYGGFSADLLNGIYRNEGVSFTNAFLNAQTAAIGLDLNQSTRQLRNTTADSEDYFLQTGNAAEAAEVRAFFDSLIEAQVAEVFPNRNTQATIGVAGQLSDGSSTRWVNANGWEYNEVFEKGHIGALQLDQIVNNYISPTFLDSGTNRADNDAGLPRNDSGSDTQMEHLWDEGFGYVYGASCDLVDVARDLGENDGGFNNYMDLVNDDMDFRGIADDIYLAFRTGRAAITASDYDTRDEQVIILRELLSEVMAVRTVYYLQQGRIKLEAARNGAGEFGDAFHDISEGLGFLLGLRYTQDPNTNQPYYNPESITDWFENITTGTPNGLWDIELSTLDTISQLIGTPFNFTPAMVATVDNPLPDAPGCN